MNIVEKYKRLDPNLIERIEENVLHFGILWQEEIVKKALDDANIEYVCGNKDSYFYNEFYVRQSGHTWKEIKEIVNSTNPTFKCSAINAIHYHIVKKPLYLYDGKFEDLYIY